MIFNKISKEAERVFRTEKTLNKNLWEEVPAEDLWEDGELDNGSVYEKVLHNVFQTGEYILVREVSDDNEHRNS
jgi:hypothetical protein